MPRWCQPWSKFIPLRQSRTVLVMSRASRLKSTVVNAIKDLASYLFYIPKAVFKTWLEIQLKVVCFPFRIVPAIWRLASPRNTSEQVDPCVSTEETTTDVGNSSSVASTESTEPPEPSSEDIVKQTKKLRNCVAMSIDMFTGNDIFWDMPILRAKVDSFSDICFEGDPVKIAAAKKRLHKHPVYYPKPKSRAEYDRLLEEAKNGSWINETVPKSRMESNEQGDARSLHDVTSKRGGHCVNETNGIANVLKPKKKVEFSLDNNETLNSNKEYRHDKKLSQQNKLLGKQLRNTNRKLEEVIKSSTGLLKEVERLNNQFTRLANMNAKISNMEREIAEGKKLVQEIEEERNEMRLKLLALEQLIKEEESFLDDLSCESGYDDIENVCDSHDEF